MRAVVLCTVLLAVPFVGSTLGAQSSKNDDAPNVSQRERVALSVETLMRYYSRDTGLWTTEGWWNSANSITVLADAAAIQPSAISKEVFRNTFHKAQVRFKLFRNDFYDDEGWWALAWMRAYEVTGRRAYLTMAESIFRDMTSGWDSTCGGGIWWKKDRHYKNAIANELFLSLAAELAHETSGRRSRMYEQWALREWAWFHQSGMINSDGLVNDGLTPACKNNGRTTWSYNQGVVMGGLVALASVTGRAAYLQDARSIADAAIRHLTDADGVLHDPTEPHCSEDTVQFKGIFVRNLSRLYGASPDRTFAAFLRANAESIWAKARTSENQFSCSWSGPAEPRGAGALTSALDALLADEAARTSGGF